MSEQTVPPTDILRLFREDLDAGDRVDAFRQAADQIRGEVEALATPENIARINDNYSVKFVFNSHGDGIDAGQSLRSIEGPFITFVENAGDADIANNRLFSISLNNAFDMDFNGASPLQSQTPPTRETAWAYWRDRGLLAKGSIIMPVDVRYYSKRLLDALMGNDYDQQYLNSSVPMATLHAQPFDELLEEQKQKGLLVMHSNAVRELTSTKQVMQTLLLCLGPKGADAMLEPALADKLAALAQKRRGDAGKLPANILYGSGHHTMFHVFRQLGIEVERDFPGAVDMPGALKFAGTTRDQFFSAHPFDMEDSDADRYARQHIIESILWCPLDNPMEYGLVPESDDMVKNLWLRIAYVARRPDLVEAAEQLHEDFKNDPLVPVKILADYGIRLQPISQ